MNPHVRSRVTIPDTQETINIYRLIISSIIPVEAFINSTHIAEIASIFPVIILSLSPQHALWRV